MNKQEKAMPVILIIVLLFLIIEFAYSVFNFIDYENRKAFGNARWTQVEERIKTIEECCECKK